MNKASKFRCGHCNTTWNTKRTYALHMSMCQFIHHSAKEHADDMDMNQLEVPSQTVMFHYILHLTQKYEDLEKKVARIQSATTRTRRKNITEYLASMPKPSTGFVDWVHAISVTEQHLQRLFDADLEECIQSILSSVMAEEKVSPMFAVTQRQHTIYVYDDDGGWHIIANEEFSRFVGAISHKVLRTYTKWSKDHYAELHANARMEEQSIMYMSKANGINRSLEKRSALVKKWLYSKLAVSLNVAEDG